MVPCLAQMPLSSDTTDKVVEINPIIISANKAEERQREVVQQVERFSAKEIRLLNPQTTADLLTQSGTIALQKSQQGGGSPILRGFEASRVLLVIDGVRMNNLIYRSGHLQNLITIDPAMLENVEVLFGPSSTMYGSDALGGVVHLYTRKPTFAYEGTSFYQKSNLSVRYGSANQELNLHGDINLGWKKFGSLTSFSYTDFNDLRMGKKPNPWYGSFGERPYYVEHMNGKDSLIRNDDPLLQKFSGYSQYDCLQKFSYKPNDNQLHTLNVQFSNSSNIPRYDRLTDPDGSGLRNAEWYYGPQTRLMTTYQWEGKDLGGFDDIQAQISHQYPVESRHNRRFNNRFLQNRLEYVNVLGYHSGFRKKTARHDLRFGLDGQYSHVRSVAYKTDIFQDTTSVIDTRYPDGGSYMHQLALYGTHTYYLSEKWLLTDGLRLGYSTLRAVFKDQTFFPFPFSTATQNNPTYSGNIGAIFLPSEAWKFSSNLALGFRVPNVDDLSKVFESVPGRIIIPNPDISPERTLTADIGISRYFGEKLYWENNGFYTWFSNAIITAPFTFEGSDSVLYDGNMSAVYANQNAQKAFIWGYSTSIKADISRAFSATAGLSYTFGRVVTDTANIPLDHIPPLNGRIGVQYHYLRWKTEVFTLFNGWKRIENYSNSGEDNQVYATPQGTPAWYTLNLRLSFQAIKQLQLQLGCDNLLDMQYRTFASGINASGRNLFASIRVGF